MSKQNNLNFSEWIFFPFATVSTTLVVQLELRISPRILEKNRNGQWDTQGHEGIWFMKKQEVKNLVALSLFILRIIHNICTRTQRTRRVLEASGKVDFAFRNKFTALSQITPSPLRFCLPEPEFLNFKEPKIRFQGTNSAWRAGTSTLFLLGS